MSGGIAYVHDGDGSFAGRCNGELVGLDPVEGEDADELRALVEEHLARTGSAVAERLLADWHSALGRFVKVIPHDYKRALADDLEPRGDNPTSSGGDGFLTTETEEAA
jgi:glutamate synthase domain-containing protein 3